MELVPLYEEKRKRESDLPPTQTLRKVHVWTDSEVYKPEIWPHQERSRLVLGLPSLQNCET